MSDDEESEGGGWLVSYADLMTLLFATFVVLYGIKPEGETVAFLGVASSIREAFMEVPDDIPLESRRGPIVRGKDVFKFWKGDVNHEKIIKKHMRSEYFVNVINKDVDLVRNIIEMLSEKKVVVDDKAGAIQLEETKSGFKIKLASSYFYKPGSYRLNKENIRKLKPLVDVLLGIERNIIIEGHTDSIPPKSELSNWELSALRASFMARYFIDYFDFPPERLSAAGYSDKKPLFSNDSPEGRKANRRVEISIRYD